MSSPDGGTADTDDTPREPFRRRPPVAAWRATARPVPPEERHRPTRFTDTDDYPYRDARGSQPPQRPRGVMGRLGARMVAASRAWSDVDGPRRSDDAHSAAAPYPAAGPPVYVYPRGRGWVRLAVVFAVACWLIWLAYDLVELGSPGEPIRGLPLAAFVAVVVYWLTRLAGYLVRVTWERGPRRSTLIPNVVTAVFIVLCGVAFLSRTPFAIEPLWELLQRQLWQ